MPYDPLHDLKAAGAVQEGHFLLSSGLHSNRYVQCALFLQYPEYAERAGRALAERLFAKLHHPAVQCVVSPAIGGLIIGHETARALDVRAVFAERREGRMVLRRGFAIQPGERVVVVEDVVTTGKSSLEVVELLEGLGAEIVGLGCIVDRRENRGDDFGRPFVSLTRLDIDNWRAEECPLCRAGDSPTSPGSRR